MASVVRWGGGALLPTFPTVETLSILSPTYPKVEILNPKPYPTVESRNPKSGTFESEGGHVSSVLHPKLSTLEP